MHDGNAGLFDLLTDEQSRLLKLIAPIESALASIVRDGFSRDAFSQIAEGIRLLSRELGIHDRREERFLFPLIDKHAANYSGPFRTDHRQIRSALERLQKSVQDVESSKLHGSSLKDITAATGETIELLRLQFRREQEELFPFAKKRLTAAEQRACAHSLLTDGQGEPS
jgi:hemerythrin-like domain-containing protein